ncbi:MAG: hypothetical protein ABIF17_03745 [Patescibacteria group bacterium]
MNIISNEKKMPHSEKYENKIIKTNFTQKKVAEYLMPNFKIFDYQHVPERISFFNNFIAEGTEQIVGVKDQLLYKVKLIKKAKLGEEPYKNNRYEIILIGK